MRHWIVCLCVVAMLGWGCAAERDGSMTTYAATVNAPDFAPGLDWLNVDHPISMKDLRGKVVVLDFWTFCCINCMHIIPDLKRLEAKYGNSLAVIGVHSAKFTTEKGTDNIRQAILRYDIEHPVVNDGNFDIWNSYAINSWPSLILIDPDGKVIGIHSGEGAFDALDGPIGKLVAQFDAGKKINRTPIALHLEKDKAPPTELLFPGKIAADEVSGHLFVSDSNHNRIVEVTPDGQIVQSIGGNDAGFVDGDFAVARFFRPQGLCVSGTTLFIADTENHSIRKVDLIHKTVTTLAGNGKQAQDFNKAGKGKDVALSSPWDVLFIDKLLYVAMAGMHQVWTIDPTSGEAKPYSGSGRENLVDGPLLQAAQAQPSGLCSVGMSLFSADSETSSIRQIDLDPLGSVRTMVGAGLFEFGDIDGGRDTARLQHPLGLCYSNGTVYIADTYNNKIKTLDIVSGKVQTLIGTGKPGFADGPKDKAVLNEPGGMAVLGGKLFIADTNNHLVRRYDPDTGEVSTLKVEYAFNPPVAPLAFKGKAVELPEQSVRAEHATIDLTINLPDGYHLNAAAPFYLGLTTDNPKVIVLPLDIAARNISIPAFPLQTKIGLSPGKAKLTVDVLVYFCQSQDVGVCLVRQMRFVVPVNVTSDASVNSIVINKSVSTAKGG